MRNNIIKLLLCVTTLVSVSACASQIAELDNVGKAPPLEKVEMPTEKLNYEPVEWEEEEEVMQAKYSNSLWQPGARAFFKDMKAKRIGDILRVSVSVKDKAEIDNATERKREGDETTSATKMFGLEEKIVGMLPGIADPANLIKMATDHNTKGEGTIQREETVETEIAAMVTQVLPNGNLVVHGDQEIRVNFEVRKITIDGIVRPEDISADNSVDSKQIAEARISYGGRGQITNLQQPRVGQQIIDILSPF